MKFPFAAVELESDGSVHDPAQLEAARAVVAGADDVLVLVHGWNNDIPAARSLYERLTDNIDAVRGQVPAPPVVTSRSSVSSGRRSSGPTTMTLPEAAPAPLTRRMLSSPRSAIATLTRAWPLNCKQLVPELDTSATARQQYLDLLRAQLPRRDRGRGGRAATLVP